MGSIDRMDWHYGGDFPENLPIESGGTHIGMYITWIIENYLYGQLHRENSAEGIKKVLTKEWTGRDFLIHECDEKFWEEDLNEEGLEFTKYYYNEEREDGLTYFLQDYITLLPEDAESLYELEDTWQNYQKLKPLIDERYTVWKSMKKNNA
jgi:hypothetical protein